MYLRSLLKRSDGNYSYIFYDGKETSFIVHETDIWKLWYDTSEGKEYKEFFNRRCMTLDSTEKGKIIEIKESEKKINSGINNDLPLVLININTDDTLIVKHNKLNTIDRNTLTTTNGGGDKWLRCDSTNEKIINTCKVRYKVSENFPIYNFVYSDHIQNKKTPKNNEFIVYSTLSKTELYTENIIEGKFNYEPYTKMYINNRYHEQFKFETMHKGKTLNRIVKNGEKNEMFEIPEGWKIIEKPLKLFPAYEHMLQSPNNSIMSLPLGSYEPVFPEQFKELEKFESLI